MNELDMLQTIRRTWHGLTGLEIVEIQKEHQQYMAEYKRLYEEWLCEFDVLRHDVPTDSELEEG